MARKQRRGTSRGRVQRGRRRPFKVKAHSRSPRGSDYGKKRPKVRAYRRSKPNPKSYPR